jgi:uracil-DNA glycosylase family 4
VNGRCGYHAEVSTADLELADLRTAALAYLAWEDELSGLGVPELGAEALVAKQETPPPVPLATATEVPFARELPAAAPQRHAIDPVVPPGMDRHQRLAQLEQEVRSCQRCELARARTQTVFARGNPESPLVFVGEGPGQEEDRLGSPFVGPAGQLLDKMVSAMGFPRDDVYICNVVKCRPPGNRTPLPSEAGACAPFLLGQIDAIAPRVIVALGRCATENLGLVGAGGGWRGRWGKFRDIDVMPTYHPAFLLRSPEFKRPVWEDLQKVMARLKQGG